MFYILVFCYWQLHYWLFTKKNPEDYKATFFSQFISKRKTKGWHWSNTILSASLRASFSMCNSGGCTGTLSPQRTGTDVVSCPSRGSDMKSCCFTHQSIRQGGWTCSWSPGTVSLLLDYPGEMLHFYQWEPTGKTAMWTWSLVLLLLAAQTFSLGSSGCVVLAVIKCTLALWQGLIAQGTTSAYRENCESHHSLSFLM